MGYNALSDQELMGLLKKSIQGAFAELYNRYKSPLYLHAYRMLQDDEEAKDVVQEMFASIWAKRENLVIPASVNAYLYRSIHNRILNFIAHQKVIASYTNSLDEYLGYGISATDEKVRERELIEILEDGVASLPPKMREVFELSRNQNLSHKQIAEQLNISDKTVKKQVNNAIKILRLKINPGFFFIFL